MLDADVAGGSIVAVGERGHVLMSKDMGGNWLQIEVPTRAMLTAVSFYDTDLGLAVGHDATILRTTDGGRNWHRVYFKPEEERPFLDVYFHDAENATAIGAYGYFLESRDGGETWRSLELTAVDHGTVNEAGTAEETYPEDFHLNHFAASETGRWYMAAEAGNIYRSDDLGATWQRLPSPYEGSFLGLLPLAADNVLIFGLQGTLLVSEDAGLTWRGIETGTRATQTSAIVLRDGRIVVAGYSGSVLILDPELTSARLKQLERRMGISAVLQLVNGDLLLFGTGGTMRLSLNALRQ